MRKVVFFAFSILLASNVMYGMSVRTIVEEMNSRYDKIMRKTDGIKITQIIKNVTDGAQISSTQIILKKDNRYRIETVSQIDLEETKTKNVILFDGENVWFISPFVGITMMPKDEAMIQGTFDSFSKLIPINSTILGEERINNDDCYIIKAPGNASIPFNKIWVSQTRFVPLKATGVLKKKLVTLIFTEYKQIRGEWSIPYKTEIIVNDKPVSTTIVKNVEIGIEIPDETFDVRSQ